MPASPPSRVLALALACSVAGVLSAQGTATPRESSDAQKSFLAGARLLDRKDLAGADAAFTRAVTLNPGRTDYVLAQAIAREHRVTDLVQQAGKARILGHDTQAEALLVQARALDPENRIVAQHSDPGPLPTTFDAGGQAPWSVNAPVLAGPITLKPGPGVHTFHTHADVKQVVTAVASAFGVRTVFDDSVSAQSVRFDLEDASYASAMPILLSMAHLFAVPLDETSILLARDTTDNRNRLERQLQETISVPGATQEQMSDLGNVIRNVFDVKQATIQNGSGSIIVRAPENTLKAVNLTLADLLDGGSQVLLDLSLYAVDTTHNRNIGATFPQQLGAYNVYSEASRLVAANQALVNQGIASGLILPTDSVVAIALKLIASGLVSSQLLSSTLAIVGGTISSTGQISNKYTTTGIFTSAQPSVTFALNSSDSRALDNIQIRVGDRQIATFRAGSRYPITTSTYSTPSLNTSNIPGTINGVSIKNLLSQFSGSNSFSQIPQIQYEDLGLTLKATPSVQKSGQVSLHLELKIEALAGTALNNIPILASRAFTSDVIVPDGQTAVLVSNLTRNESAAVIGIPGLSEIPGFQSVPDKNAEKDASELVLVLTPHVVRRRPNTSVGPRIAVTLPAGSAQ